MSLELWVAWRKHMKAYTHVFGFGVVVCSISGLMLEVRSYFGCPFRTSGPLGFLHRGGGCVELADFFSHMGVCGVNFRDLFCTWAWCRPRMLMEPPQGTFAQISEVALLTSQQQKSTNKT